MEVIKMAANPVDGICFSDYDTDTGRWFGPPGAGILLMRELEHRLNFTSQFIYSDGLWGKMIASNASHATWNGIIGKLVTSDADWSLCSVTNTLERSRVVDFSPTPFIITTKQFLFRLPDASSKQSLTYTSLLSPFDATIWSLIGLSVLLYRFARFAILSHLTQLIGKRIQTTYDANHLHTLHSA